MLHPLMSNEAATQLHHTPWLWQLNASKFCEGVKEHFLDRVESSFFFGR